MQTDTIDGMFEVMREEGDNFRYTQHNNSDGVAIFVRGEEELRKLQEGKARIEWCSASKGIPEGLVLRLDYRA